MRGQQITYQVGEEVDRFSIRAGYNVWRLQAILSASLTQAARKAEKRGAKKGASERAVFIPLRPVVSADAPNTRRESVVSLTNYADEDIQGKTGAIIMLSETDLIRAAADSIRLKKSRCRGDCQGRCQRGGG